MIKHTNKTLLISITFTILALLSACGRTEAEALPDGNLEIVATTTFIGDVIHQIAGDIPSITVLLEPGQNPHSYQPTPQDMVRISQANAIFVNGLDLEEFLDDLLESTATQAELVVVSEGIQLLDRPDPIATEDENHDSDDEDGHETGSDPHVWFDPNNLIIWTENIVDALSALDPEHASVYQANGQIYKEELISLDKWIWEEVERIPKENRNLVTDHTSLGYFAEKYGFRQVGAVVPALTTEAETSGQELARLIDMIRDNQVKAIFIGFDFNPTLAERVAEETGVELVPLYFGSLSEGEPAGTYLDFIRYDVSAIISALE